MFKQEDFIAVNGPTVGTYSKSQDLNSGMRFRYIQAGPISFYWYDDKIEAFKFGHKFIQATNWEGRSYERGRLQRDHLINTIKIELEADDYTDADEKHKILSECNLSRFCNSSNLSFIIKQALDNGELTKEVIRESAETFNHFRREGILDSYGNFIK